MKRKSLKTALVLWGATDLGPPHFSGDMLWRTGFKAPDPFLLVEIDGKKYVLVSSLELERAAKESSAEAVNILEYGLTEEQALISFLHHHGVKKIVIPDSFSYILGAALKKNFKVETTKPPFYPERAIKSAWEIGEIEKAQSAVERAVIRAIDFLEICEIRDGRVMRVYDLGGGHVITSEFIRNMIDSELYRAGYLGINTIVACGAQAASPHCRGSGDLLAYQPIVMDVFPLSMEAHYYADMTRTIFKGEPSDALKFMYETVLHAQIGAIEQVRAGEDGYEIYKWVSNFFQLNLYPTDFTKRPMEGFFHGVGHGVGIDIHEPPRISSTHDILKEGMVVTVEPGLYYSQARDHIPVGGIRIEDMVLVTSDGCHNLTQFPKDLKNMIIP